MFEEPLAPFLVGEREDLVDGPGRSGARREVELYVVFVLIEPGIEQERLKLHARTSEKNWLFYGFRPSLRG
ncbi:MAG TPA: hypothetical protein VE994_20540 [Terriglobales bacterium]|nr:hypothetical protein [Terriglobales bacterium]